jgi:small subunit ribosomal protein S8
MPVSDPIADMLTCIRNAIQARHRRVDVPASKIKSEIAQVLLRESYVRNVKAIADENQGVLRIYLKYHDGTEPVIKGIKRVSKPGRRVYVKKDEIPRVLRGLGTAIVSTSQGVLTDKEAREKGVGGELVATVW